MTTIESILKLSAGKELDAAVHSALSGKEVEVGLAPKYSTPSAANKIIAEFGLPLSSGRMADNDIQWSKDRPYFAEDTRPITARGQKRIRVVAASPEVALCKAACILLSGRSEVGGAKP